MREKFRPALAKARIAVLVRQFQQYQMPSGHGAEGGIHGALDGDFEMPNFGSLNLDGRAFRLRIAPWRGASRQDFHELAAFHSRSSLRISGLLTV
jgi:hypothetical protein